MNKTLRYVTGLFWIVILAQICIYIAVDDAHRKAVMPDVWRVVLSDIAGAIVLYAFRYLTEETGDKLVRRNTLAGRTYVRSKQEYDDLVGRGKSQTEWYPGYFANQEKLAKRGANSGASASVTLPISDYEVSDVPTDQELQNYGGMAYRDGNEPLDRVALANQNYEVCDAWVKAVGCGCDPTVMPYCAQCNPKTMTPERRTELWDVVLEKLGMTRGAWEDDELGD
jgi:hypothetical protein